jgi:hypothetical protein
LAAGPSTADAEANGGGGGTGNFGFNGPTAFGGNGGDATAIAGATALGAGPASATATATGGAPGPAGEPGVIPGISGSASAQSTATGADGSVKTLASSPAAGSAASAMTVSKFGSVGAALVPIVAGQTVSDAALGAGPSLRATGAMSAGYGGSGETETYSTEADFAFTTSAPEELFLTLLDNNASGVGFDNLSLQIDVNGKAVLSLHTASLTYAETFFTDHTFDFGALAVGDQSLDLIYTLTASEVGAGFGFTYETGVPEASTWAMLLTGFAGLGFAAWRRARAC